MSHHFRLLMQSVYSLALIILILQKEGKELSLTGHMILSLLSPIRGLLTSYQLLYYPSLLYPFIHLYRHIILLLTSFSIHFLMRLSYLPSYPSLYKYITPYPHPLLQSTTLYLPPSYLPSYPSLYKYFLLLHTAPLLSCNFVPLPTSTLSIYCLVFPPYFSFPLLHVKEVLSNFV